MFNKYIDEIFKSKKVFYAHTKDEGSQNELLSSHMELTYKYYNKMNGYKDLEKTVKRMIKRIYPDIHDLTLEKSYELFESAIYYHDIGKINPAFQKEKMNNNVEFIKVSNDIQMQDSSHSALSSKIYIDAYVKQLLDTASMYKNDDAFFLLYLIYYFGYIISRHHSQIESLEDFVSNFENKEAYGLYDFKCPIKEYGKVLDNKNIELFIKNLNIDKVAIYILCKLLYSCMVTADYYATYEFMNNGKQVEFDKEKDLDLFKEYKQSKLFKDIELYKKGKKKIEGIDKLRSDMFIEVEENIQNNMNNNIFYLEAPTGAGKTNMAINIARILYNNDKIIKNINYVFPFNTLVEQTSNTFSKYFKEYEEYVVINSVTPMSKDISENMDFNEAYVTNVFRHYPLTITSHVNLFDTLFGISKGNNYILYDLVNSVIILDEIQLYSNNIWRQIIIMLNKYADLLNIKFVIMSATLPKLDHLLDGDKDKFCNLIKNKSIYYNNPLFKKRVELDFSLLYEEDMDIYKLKEIVMKYKGKKILVEFIKKSTARKMFELLKEECTDVYELTGDDNSYTRHQVINKANTLNSIIVVATQTIEAGVDIDMDIGFKDISFLDSEEQFIGRINRSSKNPDCSKAYFFNIDDANKIYRNDNRLEFNLLSKEVQTLLIEKDFDGFYEKVMDKIYKNTEKFNKNNIINLYDNCSRLDYKNVKEAMKLINTNTIQIFLNHSLKIDGLTIKGEDVFKEYKTLCMDYSISYTEKQIRLSNLTSKMNLFTYNIYNNKDNIIIGEKFGNMYYIHNGEDYIKDGKFDREKYIGWGEGLFI